jgi:hypothetical protein
VSVESCKERDIITEVMLKVEILRNERCLSWKAFRDAMKYWLRMWGLNKRVKLKVILISTDSQARKYGFFGSPQLLINGCDVDPAPKKLANYHARGHRFYFWKGVKHKYPPKEMAEKAILRIPGICPLPKSKRSK